MFSTYLNSELKNVKRLLGTRFYQILAFLMAKPRRINTKSGIGSYFYSWGAVIVKLFKDGKASYKKLKMK